MSLDHPLKRNFDYASCAAEVLCQAEPAFLRPGVCRPLRIGRTRRILRVSISMLQALGFALCAHGLHRRQRCFLELEEPANPTNAGEPREPTTCTSCKELKCIAKRTQEPRACAPEQTAPNRHRKVYWHMHAEVHEHMHIHMSGNMHTHVPVRMPVLRLIPTRKYTYTYTHTHLCPYLYLYTYTNSPTPRHIHMPISEYILHIHI